MSLPAFINIREAEQVNYKLFKSDFDRIYW